MPIKMGDVLLVALVILCLLLWKPKGRSRAERRGADDHEQPDVPSEVHAVHTAPTATVQAAPAPEHVNAPAHADQEPTGLPVNVLTRHILFGDRILQCQEYRVNGNLETRVCALGYRGRPKGRVEVRREPLQTAVDALIKAPI